MKKVFFILLLSFSTFFIYAQTNVSGVISSNTTWTKANSPYIVVDTVIVNQNVTLTIQPGVVVRFANNKRLEIKQGSIIANGTASDSITFTSNSGTPIPGIWSTVFLNTVYMPVKFNYCNFYFANNGILCQYNGSNNVLIKIPVL